MTRMQTSPDGRADSQSPDDILFAEPVAPQHAGADWQADEASAFEEGVGDQPDHAPADALEAVDFGADVLNEQPVTMVARRPREGRRPLAVLVPLLLALAGGGGAAWFLLVATNPVLAAISGSLGLVLATLAWCWMR